MKNVLKLAKLQAQRLVLFQISAEIHFICFKLNLDNSTSGGNKYPLGISSNIHIILKINMVLLIDKFMGILICVTENVSTRKSQAHIRTSNSLIVDIKNLVLEIE